jgi:hypothetical protein
MEGVFFILIFVGVIAITAILFGIWVFVGIIRIIARIVMAVFAPCPTRRRSMPISRALPSIRCGNDRCHAMNPANARFCRRCGQAVETQRVHTRRVACW